MLSTSSSLLGELIHGVSQHQSMKCCVGLVDPGGFSLPETTQELEALGEKSRRAGLQLPQAVTSRGPHRTSSTITVEVYGVFGYLKEQVQEVLRCTGTAAHAGSADEHRGEGQEEVTAKLDRLRRTLGEH